MPDWLTLELVCIVSFGVAMQVTYVLAFWALTKALEKWTCR